MTIVDLRTAAELSGLYDESVVPPWRGRVDGMLIAIGYDGPTAELVEWVIRGGVPAVSVRGDIFEPRLPVICVDPESIVRLAVDHLLSVGAASFLHLGHAQSGGSRRRAAAAVDLLAGRKRAAVTHDLDALVFGGLDDEEVLARDRRLSDLLTTLPRPVGVVCLNDNVARAVVLRCGSLGLEVGRDVLVVGVDDTALAASSVPSITSIQVPCEAVAARGLAVLREMIAAGRGLRPGMPVEMLPAETLVARESTLGRAGDSDALSGWLTYLAEHGFKGYSTARVAEELGVSQRTFERQFRKLTGHTLAEEIRHRLERAKVRLADPALPISGIASEVGFAEAAAFSRFFRKHVGISPREFRRNARQPLRG